MSNNRLFKLGQLVMTAGVNHWAKESAERIKFLGESLTKHRKGEWGELFPEDKKMNDDAVKNGDRILSKYSFDNTSIYIITEYDRSVTTILFPSEY